MCLHLYFAHLQSNSPLEALKKKDNQAEDERFKAEGWMFVPFLCASQQSMILGRKPLHRSCKCTYCGLGIAELSKSFSAQANGMN